MNDDDLLARGMQSEEASLMQQHAQHRKFDEPISSLSVSFPLASTCSYTTSNISHNAPQVINLQQQLKDLLHYPRKTELGLHSSSSSKDSVIEGKVMPSYQEVSDSLTMSLPTSLGVQQNIIISHPAVLTTVEGSTALPSMSGLQMSSRTTVHQEPFQSVGIPITDRGSLSCENSLSELTATIGAPVNLIESSSDSFFDSPNSIKDVFASVTHFPSKESSLLNHDSSKVEKDSINSSNSISSSHLMKLIQSCKSESSCSLPVRISDFGKMSNDSLKSTLPTSSTDFQDRSDKLTNTSPGLHASTISSHELNAFSNFRAPTPLSENNSLNSHIVVANTSVSQGLSHITENHLVLSGSKSLHSLHTQHPTCITETSFSNHYPNSHVVNRSHYTNSHTVNRIPNSQIHMLPETVVDKGSKRVLHASSSDTNMKDTRYTFTDDPMSKVDRMNARLPSLHSSSRRETFPLTGDQLISATSVPSDIEAVNNLSFIPDQHDQMLSHIAHILPNDGVKDSRSMRPEDLFLSDLHSPDESELGLGAPLTSAIASDIPSNLTHSTSPAVSEVSLSASVGNSSHNLPELPPSPILANISPSQPSFLPNLSTTTDLALTFSSNFLENSNMSMDIGCLSEGDASLNIPSHSSSDTLESPKKICTSSELNFTSALKKATEKSNSEHHKNKFMTVDNARYIMKINNLCQDSAELSPNSKSYSMSHPSSEIFKVPPPSPDLSSVLAKSKSPHSDDSVISSSSSSVNTDSRDEKIYGKVSPKFLCSKEDPFCMVQQVSCYKCQVCSYLSLDKNEMTEHTRLRHAKHRPMDFRSTPSPSSPTAFLKPDRETATSSRMPKMTQSKIKREFSLSQFPQEQLTRETTSPEYLYFRKAAHSINTAEDRQANWSFTKNEKMSPVPTDEDISNPDDPDFASVPIKAESEIKIAASSDSATKLLTHEEQLSLDIQEQSTHNRDSQKPKPGRPTASQTTGIIKLKKSNPKAVIPEEMLGFRCGVNGCGLKLKIEDNIVYHRKCHAEAFLKCPECKTKFTHWSSLAMHLWRNHMIDMELHKCEKCNYKSYSYTKLMNGHWRTHSTERPFLCDVCGKDFKTAKQLRSHKALHADKKEELKHHCDMCKRKFAEKRMLLSHLEAVHKKVKPYLCNYCGNSFASKSTLNLHIRIHTGEKPFACESCDYKTSDHNSMRRHKMKHTNDKRYACPYCEYTSIQSSTFKVHLRRKHEMQAQKDGVIFPCPYCTFKTVKKDNILSHIGTHHKIPEEERLKILTSDFKVDLGQSSVDANTRKENPKKKQKIKKTPIKHSSKDSSLQPQQMKQEVQRDPQVVTITEQVMMSKESPEKHPVISSNVETVRINGTNLIPIQTSLRNGQTQTIYLVGGQVPVSLVIGDTDMVTADLQSDLMNGVTVFQQSNLATPVSNAVLMSDVEHFALTQGSAQQGTVIHPVSINDRLVHFLTPEVTATPLSTDMTSTVMKTHEEGISEVIYVTQSNEVDPNGRFGLNSVT